MKNKLLKEMQEIYNEVQLIDETNTKLLNKMVSVYEQVEGLVKNNNLPEDDIEQARRLVR